VNPNLPAENIPNSHMLRNSAAVQAEILSGSRRAEYIAEFVESEDLVFDILKEHFSSTVKDQNEKFSKIAVIHSCLLFENQNPKALMRLLSRINSSGLRKELKAVYVFHYGHAIADEYVKLYNEWDIMILHISSHTLFFEIPSIRLVSRLARHLVSIDRASTQVLYMHTKGVSYEISHPQIDNWIDLMLYHLVDRYRSCDHILQSGEFDAVGVNYVSHPRMFSGNFWWSLASYLAIPHPLEYLTSGKYDPEQWLFLSSKIRVHVPHVSNVVHASQRYPRYCYAAVDELETPSFAQYMEVCGEDNIEEYRFLHDRVAQRQQSQNAMVNPDTAKSTARCTALDLYTNVK
jgi:hypothetical protein